MSSGKWQLLNQPLYLQRLNWHISDGDDGGGQDVVGVAADFNCASAANFADATLSAKKEESRLRSSASAICSDWHSTGSTQPDCNWTTKFCSQQTSHMEPSATSTTVTGPVGQRLQAGTKDTPVLDRPAPLRRFIILAPDINIQTYLLTYLWSYLLLFPTHSKKFTYHTYI